MSKQHPSITGPNLPTDNAAKKRQKRLARADPLTNMTPAQLCRERVLWREAGERNWPKCWAKEHLDGHDHCDGPLDVAHVIPRQTVRTKWKQARVNSRMSHHPLLEVELEEVEDCEDNCVLLCRAAHESWDKRGRRPLYGQLPDHARDFAYKYWLQRELHSRYADE